MRPLRRAASAASAASDQTVSTERARSARTARRGILIGIVAARGSGLAASATSVAEHVGHLERLAEAHALLAHVAEVPVPEPWAVGDVQRRPEGADTAGDEIRVTVELVERVERGQARGVLAGEAREIEDHASRER